VRSFNGEDHECSKYNKEINEAKEGGIKFGYWSAFYYGLFYFVMFVIYGISYLIGPKMIYDENFNHN